MTKCLTDGNIRGYSLPMNETSPSGAIEPASGPVFFGEDYPEYDYNDGLKDHASFDWTRR